MRLNALFSRLPLTAMLAISCLVARADAASVWKVTGPNGGALYLGGSIHALRSTDYPLPSAYNRAFDASARLAFEASPEDLRGLGKNFLKSGQYPKGDSLKNHVDPRTYDYLRRFFEPLKIPEEKFAKLRPWFLAALLQAPQLHGLSPDLGVEGFLARRARANSKPIFGLESSREGIEIFSGLTDRQSEAWLLLTFIPAKQGTGGAGRMLDAWRHGDADSLTRITLDPFHDFPSLGERIVGARNRNWILKIEGISAVVERILSLSELGTWEDPMVCWLYFAHAAIRSNNSDRAESGRFEVFSFVKPETLFFVRRWLLRRISEQAHGRRESSA